MNIPFFVFMAFSFIGLGVFIVKWGTTEQKTLGWTNLIVWIINVILVYLIATRGPIL